MIKYFLVLLFLMSSVSAIEFSFSHNFYGGDSTFTIYNTDIAEMDMMISIGQQGIYDRMHIVTNGSLTGMNTYTAPGYSSMGINVYEGNTVVYDSLYYRDAIDIASYTTEIDTQSIIADHRDFYGKVVIPGEVFEWSMLDLPQGRF